MTKIRFSFEPGYLKLPLGEVKAFRAELMKVLGLKYQCNVSQKRRRITRKDEYEKVTELFARYGVPENEVWTEVTN